MSPTAFVAKWLGSDFGEKQASQEMFLDICGVLETGGRMDRGGTLISFRDISELFLARGDEVGAAQMRWGLEGLGIPTSTRAVNLGGLAEGWEQYGRRGPGTVG